MKALWNRFRVEPRNIRLDEVVDELGLVTGQDRETVKLRVMETLTNAHVPATRTSDGWPLYFPEALA